VINSSFFREWQTDSQRARRFQPLHLKEASAVERHSNGKNTVSIHRLIAAVLCPISTRAVHARCTQHGWVELLNLFQEPSL
jgi:hypothetical protein